MNRLKDVAATLVAVAGALGVVGALAWWWLSPKIEDRITASEERQGQRLALIASAVATGDTVTLRVFSRYGVPLGPAGR